MIEKKLFIQQYSELCDRFKRMLDLTSCDEISPEYDKLLCDVEELLEVLPYVEGVNIKTWQSKIGQLKYDIFSEYVMISESDLNL